MHHVLWKMKKLFNGLLLLIESNFYIEIDGMVLSMCLRFFVKQKRTKKLLDNEDSGPGKNCFLPEENAKSKIIKKESEQIRIWKTLMDVLRRGTTTFWIGFFPLACCPIPVSWTFSVEKEDIHLRKKEKRSQANWPSTLTYLSSSFLIAISVARRISMKQLSIVYDNCPLWRQFTENMPI